MRIRFIRLIMIAAIWLVPACSGGRTATNEAQPSTTAGPIDPAATEVLVPSPQPGKALITGSLIRRSYDENPDSPYRGLRVYLGVTLADDQGNMSVGRVDRNNAPTSRTDDQGQFAFSDVEPGTYILAVLLPPNNIIMLKDPGSGGDMLLEVSDGQILDLGELLYDFPLDTGS